MIPTEIANAPHKAAILMTVEVHDINKSGQCSGNPAKEDELKEYGLSPKVVLGVDGFNRDDCLRKLQRKLEAFKQCQ